ncbi:phage tail protein [Azoarcus sp. L1K30]|uniref:phage tail protein n=1 Tax=Azoarcus sp. L1K30 TaxID=2820277 RepID=UPI001B828F00|nr:phage tail protein [Azoarcus sp. L1K30]
MSTFIWIATYGSNVETKPNVAVAEFGDGYEQRVGLGLNITRRRWNLQFNNRPNDTADAIEGFLKARNGIESFDWTPKYGGAGKWVCCEWSSIPTSPNTRSVTATFEEVFEL